MARPRRGSRAGAKGHLMNVQVISRRAFLATAAGVTASTLLLRESAAQSRDASKSAIVAAENISRLEVIPSIPALSSLYALMHLDAQAIVPRDVVVRYMQEAFQTRSPRKAVV